MASYDWADLLKQAEEAGLEYELTPPGEYHVQVVNTNVTKSQGGKDKIGVQLKILDGPRGGKSFWDNITVSPENTKAMAIFFRTVSNYGGDINVLRSGGTLDQLAQSFVGRQGVVNLQHRTWQGKALHDVKSFRPDTPGAAAPTPPAPDSTPPSGPAPQPEPVAAGAAPAASAAVPF